MFRKATQISIALSLLAAGAVYGEVVVVVNPQSAAASMTADQVADVYLGKSSSLSPVDLPESSEVRTEFYKKIAGKDSAQVKAVWARLVFTGKATPPKEVASSADVKKAVAGDAKAIGYMEKSAVDGTVKVVFTAP